MADKKITALTESTALSTDDLFHVVDSPSSSPSNKKITVSNVMNKVPTFLGLNSTETVSANGALSTSTAISLLSGTGSAPTQTTLADISGTAVGQMKTIIRTHGGTGTVDVDLTTTAGAMNSIAFDEVGASVTLMWSGTAGWVIMSSGTGATGSDNNGITTATV